jgi:hypothetical protein
VSTQAAAWTWPAVVTADSFTEAHLDYWWAWCRSADCAAQAARCMRGAADGTLVPQLLQAITEP